MTQAVSQIVAQLGGLSQEERAEDRAGAEISWLPECSEAEGQLMSWFAAHLVMYVKFKEHEQQQVPVWENIILVRADSEEEAMNKAERRGQEDAADDDPSFKWGGKPAKWVFAGVRKLTYCDPDKRPDDGTEITYVEMQLESEDAVRKFVAGEPVPVYYADKFREGVGS